MRVRDPAAWRTIKLSAVELVLPGICKYAEGPKLWHIKGEGRNGGMDRRTTLGEDQRQIDTCDSGGSEH